MWSQLKLNRCTSSLKSCLASRFSLMFGHKFVSRSNNLFTLSFSNGGRSELMEQSVWPNGPIETESALERSGSWKMNEPQKLNARVTSVKRKDLNEADGLLKSLATPSRTRFYLNTRSSRPLQHRRVVVESNRWRWSGDSHALTSFFVVRQSVALYSLAFKGDGKRATRDLWWPFAHSFRLWSQFNLNGTRSTFGHSAAAEEKLRKPGPSPWTGFTLIHCTDKRTPPWSLWILFLVWIILRATRKPWSCFRLCQQEKGEEAK